MWSDILYNVCLKHFSFYEELSEISLPMYTGLHVKTPLFLSDFNETWTFSADLRKILKYQISWKSVQWNPGCSMRTEGGQTDMKLLVTFRSFANAPKSSALCTTRVGVLRVTGLVVLTEDLRECIPGRTVTTDGRRFPLRPLESKTYFTHYRAYTHNSNRTLPISGFQGGPWATVNHLAKTEVPQSQPNTELEEASPILL